MIEKIDVILKVRNRGNFNFLPYLKSWHDQFKKHPRYRVIIWNDSDEDLKSIFPNTRIKTQKHLKGIQYINSIVQASVCEKIWRPACRAHCSTFWIAKSKIFWNIDADDMKFIEPIDFDVLKQIEDHMYGHPELFSMSWDLYWTLHKRYGNIHPHHWTFGFNISRKDTKTVEWILKQPCERKKWGLNIDLMMENVMNRLPIYKGVGFKSFVFKNKLNLQYKNISTEYIGNSILETGLGNYPLEESVLIFDKKGIVERNMMKVMVTGSEGVIGSALCRELEKMSDIQLVRYDKRLGDDITDYPKLLGKLRGCDVVVHLAGIPGPHGNFKYGDFFWHNCHGTFRLASACKEAGVKRVIYSSSGAYYGLESTVLRRNKDKILPVKSEDIAECYLKVAEPDATYHKPELYYMSSKVIAEAILGTYGLTKDFQVVIIRLAPVDPIKYPEVPSCWGAGLKKVSCVKAFISAIKSEKELWYEIFNIASDDGMNTKKAEEMLGFQK